MACPCCVFCNAHVRFMMQLPVISIHLCISESSVTHIGLDCDIFFYFILFLIMWVEWNGCLFLSCLVLCHLFSWLSFLLLMWLTGCVLSASEGCEMCVMCVCFCVCWFACLRKNTLCYFSPFSIHNRVRCLYI